VTPEIPDDPSRDDLVRVSREAGVSVEKLVALSRDKDPFLQGTEAHTRDADEFVRLTANVNLDVHLRGLHYRLLSLGTTGYNEKWEWLQKAARRARDLGLIDPWAFPSGGLRQISGFDASSQANADAQALASLNGYRRHAFGTDGTNTNKGPKSGTTLVPGKN
jgi:hypothetical protein